MADNQEVCPNCGAKKGVGNKFFAIMFDNIGRKIKTLAMVICWVGIALSVIVALCCFATNNVGPGLIVLIFGSLASWLGSFYMYGFGELIETNSTIVELLRR